MWTIDYLMNEDYPDIRGGGNEEGTLVPQDTGDTDGDGRQGVEGWADEEDMKTVLVDKDYVGVGGFPTNEPW